MKIELDAALVARDEARTIATHNLALVESAVKEARAALASSPPGRAVLHPNQVENAKRFMALTVPAPPEADIEDPDHFAAPEAARSLSAEDVEKVRHLLRVIRENRCGDDGDPVGCKCGECSLCSATEALAILDGVKK